MAQPQFNQRQKDISRLLREKKSGYGAQLKGRAPVKAGFAARKMGGR